MESVLSTIIMSSSSLPPKQFNSLGLPPSIRTKLCKGNYVDAKDIVRAGPVQLSKDLNISKEDALNYVRRVSRCLGLGEKGEKETYKENNRPPSSHSSSSRCTAPTHHQPLHKKLKTATTTTTTTISNAEGRRHNRGGTPRGSRYHHHHHQHHQSALDLLRKEETDSSRIVSFCKSLDEILKGGIPTGSLTELCGSPGVGKTQFSMQLSANVQIPSYCGGLFGSCIFIDTEGSFMPERMHQIARGLYLHLTRSGKTSRRDRVLSDFPKGVDDFMRHVHVFRVHDYTQQMCVVKRLEEVIRDIHGEEENTRRVRLVVIDSVSFHFRRDFNDMFKRSRVLSEMSQELHRVAKIFDCAVVMTNQMTTKFSRSSGIRGGRERNEMPSSSTKRSNAYLVPALGESWSHASTHRIRLRKIEQHGEDTVRVAQIVKSPNHAPGRAYYKVTPNGVRGISAVTAKTKTKQHRSPVDVRSPECVRSVDGTASTASSVGAAARAEKASSCS